MISTSITGSRANQTFLLISLRFNGFRQDCQFDSQLCASTISAQSEQSESAKRRFLSVGPWRSRFWPKLRQLWLAPSSLIRGEIWKMQQQYKFKQEIIEQKMYVCSYFLISCHAIAQTKKKKESNKNKKRKHFALSYQGIRNWFNFLLKICATNENFYWLPSVEIYIRHIHIYSLQQYSTNNMYLYILIVVVHDSSRVNAWFKLSQFQFFIIYFIYVHKIVTSDNKAALYIGL